LNFSQVLKLVRSSGRISGTFFDQFRNRMNRRVKQKPFLANRTERRDAVNSLWHDQLRLLAVTLGSRGAEVYTPDGSVHVPSFPVTPIDTTGAGDGFVAGLLSRLVSKTRVSLQDAAEACRRANMVGALATTKRGAINAMPWLADLPASAGL
jgi:fructokinase